MSNHGQTQNIQRAFLSHDYVWDIYLCFQALNKNAEADAVPLKGSRYWSQKSLVSSNKYKMSVLVYDSLNQIKLQMILVIKVNKC